MRALDELRPDAVLVEGPPDADEVITFAGNAETEPPVALLVYAPESLERAVFYPFAQFSPEWQAIRWGLQHQVPVRFMDLPQAHQLTPETDEVPIARRRADPLGILAEAAGETDGERWWERMVEHRHDTTGLFAAVLEAMTEARSASGPEADPMEQKREAWMRQTIRTAEKQGFARIAVVCGAWHAPALAEMPSAKADAALLKGLPKVKVAATWVPWTHGRLQAASGYGAGIESPGWYQHIWETPDEVTIRWVSRVARLVREQDLDASPAHIIETVRLAETLASLRQSSMPGLRELQEAVQTVMLVGNSAPLALIHQKLIVGEVLGRVPDATPAIPLQRDLQATQKRLRFPAEAGQKVIDLDLRKPTDLERSYLLHRLTLLGIPWGVPEKASTGKGTFHEFWRVEWQPEFAVRIVAAAVWGNTVEEATAACAGERSRQAQSMPELTALLEVVLLGAVKAAIPALLSRLAAESAVAADVRHLMMALPALVRIERYGDVRQTDVTQIRVVVIEMITRIAAGLPAACGSLDDDAAQAMLASINAAQEGVSLLAAAEPAQEWRGALGQVAGRDGVHGLVAGRCVRLLFDAGEFDREEAFRRMSFALSRAADPAQGAAWVEGFLKGSGLLLVHDEKLWSVIDGWVSELKDEAFVETLPLLARTFAAFAPAERRQMGERVRSGRSQAAAQAAEAGFDQETAEAVLPLMALIFGVKA